MRYIKFEGSAPYCGTDFEDVAEFEDTATDGEIDEYAAELAHDNGESYSYLCTGWGENFEDEEDEEIYYANCECGWTEITKEEYERMKEEGY